MTKQHKNILIGVGVLVAAYLVYHRFIKKDKYTGAFLGADGQVTTDGNPNPSGARRKPLATRAGTRGAATQAQPTSASNQDGGIAIPNMGLPPMTGGNYNVGAIPSIRRNVNRFASALFPVHADPQMDTYMRGTKGDRREINSKSGFQI